MRRLAARLVVSLLALTLIGLSVVDVVFVLWLQRRAVAEEMRLLESAAVALGEAAKHEPDLGDLHRLSKRLGVSATLMGKDGTRFPHEALPIEAPGLTVAEGYRHFAVPVEGDGPWKLAVVAREVFVPVAQVLATNGSALAVLAASGFMMILLGTWFLRRAVLRPVTKLTELVGERDYDALAQLDSQVGASDDLAQLGRSISSMNRKIEEDRQRMLEQLEALTQAHGELEAAQRQLIRAERLAVVGQLAAGLAHEIGNPLAVVSGYIDILKGRPEHDAGTLNEALERMTRELDRIQETVRHLLDFSRAQHMQPERGDVKQVLEHVRSLIEPQDRLRGVELRWDCPPEVPKIQLGGDAMTQVLLNLLLNAIDAAAGEGVIALSVSAGADSVCIHVDDSGPGVSEQAAERIFDPFFTTKEPGQGTGLGLAVCDRMVATAGGDLRYEKGPLGGARFTVSVPIARER